MRATVDSPNAPSVRDDGLSEAEAAKQRLLRAVVIGLGIMILLAFAAVVAGMAYRASRIGTPAGASARPATTASPLAGPKGAPTGAARPTVAGEAVLLPQMTLALPAGSVVKSSSLSGTHLVVQYDGPAGAGIAILDLTTGAVVSRVTIEPASR